MCTKETNTSIYKSANLVSYIACRLIPLDKQPGIRPIGIGEVLRRILWQVQENFSYVLVNLQDVNLIYMPYRNIERG